MSVGKLRAGELVALLGAAAVFVSLTLRWYEGPSGPLDAWDTFGVGLALLLAAAVAALWLFASTLTERSGTALAVVAGVWCVAFGVAGVIAAIVRVLERPDHATEVCAGAWVALAGALAILLGAWLSVHDERVSRYPPAAPAARPRPEL
jgi:hypothetical protein